MIYTYFCFNADTIGKENNEKIWGIAIITHAIYYASVMGQRRRYYEQIHRGEYKIWKKKNTDNNRLEDTTQDNRDNYNVNYDFLDVHYDRVLTIHPLYLSRTVAQPWGGIPVPEPTPPPLFWTLCI